MPIIRIPGIPVDRMLQLDHFISNQILCPIKSRRMTRHISKSLNLNCTVLSGRCSGDTNLVFDRYHVQISDDHTGYPAGGGEIAVFSSVTPNIRDSTSIMPRTLLFSNFPTHHSRTPYRWTLLQFGILCH